MSSSLRTRLFCAVLFFPCLAPAAEPQAITLPKPKTEGGKPLMQALKERQSAREFAPQKLSVETLSNLLWAAGGINRPDGRRTAPTASNKLEIDIYAVLPDGAYFYNPKAHSLEPVVSGDLRAAAGTQGYVKDAALNLVFVADYSRMGGTTDEARAVTAAVDTGFVSQNAYLFCASEGLATVVRGSVDRAALAKALHLRPEQHITYSQSVGYAKK